MLSHERFELAVLIKSLNLFKKKQLDPQSTVKDLCEHYGVARKTGYEYAQELDDIIGDGFDEKKRGPKPNVEQMEQYQHDLQASNRRVIALEIELGIVKTIAQCGDNPEDQRRCHVGMMRRYKQENKLTYLEYANISGISYSTLINWDKEYDRHLKKVQGLKKLLCGGSNHIGYRIVEEILRVWDTCQKGLREKISVFCRYFNREKKSSYTNRDMSE